MPIGPKDAAAFRRVSLVLSVALLSAALTSGDRDAVSGSDEGRRTIPFQLDRNRIILPVRVGPSPDLQIVLDTGMHYQGLLLYNKELADQLALENATEVKVSGAVSGLPATAMIDSVSLRCHEGDAQRWRHWIFPVRRLHRGSR